MPVALITGITGQDGSYLTELLLAKGYEVHGLVRPSSNWRNSPLGKFADDSSIYNRRLFLHSGELGEPTLLRRAFFKSAPSEVYHLAGQTHVGLSFEIPEETCRTVILGTTHLLELVRDMKPAPKFFHASSSQIFGEPEKSPQDEETPLRPINPYGCAKACATQMVQVYRKAHGLFTCNGILFNHESPRRRENFVTRKICRGAAAIKAGIQNELLLGDLQARRDWGHACDYVEGMWLSMQASQPDDFVFATGQLHSVEDVVEAAFASVQLEWKRFVRHDPGLARPAEAKQMVGNPAKAKQLLNWQPRVTFRELIAEMTQSELSALSSK